MSKPRERGNFSGCGRNNAKSGANHAVWFRRSGVLLRYVPPPAKPAAMCRVPARPCGPEKLPHRTAIILAHRHDRERLPIKYSTTGQAGGYLTDSAPESTHQPVQRPFGSYWASVLTNHGRCRGVQTAGLNGYLCFKAMVVRNHWSVRFPRTTVSHWRKILLCPRDRREYAVLGWDATIPIQ